MLLERKNILRLITGTLALAACFCLLAYGGEKKPAFPHDKHMADAKCLDCHETADTKAKPGFPTADTCSGCHEPDEYKSVDFVSLKKRAPYLKSQFSHAAHSGNECSDCHGDLSKAPPKIPAYNDCEKCHAENEITPSCKECHGKQRFLPPNHNHAWNKRHGLYQKAAAAAPEHGNDCEACHTGHGCRSCHQKQKPQTHTGFWRIKGHGLRAQADRNRCATCHVESYCVRCHQTTRPLIHRGNWKFRHGLAVPGGKAGTGTTCMVCHNPGQCAACHSR